ncbi:hypothetical protein KAU33_08605 [Candidatus Dependentiae bacterium]|nr:hypothetical protein [Candidatus Dependentiae bacterium]
MGKNKDVKLNDRSPEEQFTDLLDIYSNNPEFQTALARAEKLGEQVAAAKIEKAS